MLNIIIPKKLRNLITYEDSVALNDKATSAKELKLFDYMTDAEIEEKIEEAINEAQRITEEIEEINNI